MKVTAFIRKTAAKNNITSQARVYFRVRDIGGVDIKAASELSISPNHWSAEKQGYRSRVALVSDSRRMEFDRDVQAITHLITQKYHRGVDGAWLKGLIEEYHHPGINRNAGRREEEYSLAFQCARYIEDHRLAPGTIKKHKYNIGKILRYERFQREIAHRRSFSLRVDTITADDLRDLHDWLRREHEYVERFPAFYKDVPLKINGQLMAENSITGYLRQIRTVIRWCVKKGLTGNNPFDDYKITSPMYGDPFYLTIEERDRVYGADLSGLSPIHSIYRDIFVFQCLIGCRVSDLHSMTRANLVGDAVEYIPQKTKGELPRTVRVPLNGKAREILDKYSYLENRILPEFSPLNYNTYIKRILKHAGVDRTVIVLNPRTREEEARPLYEVVSSHTARKTFIGNLYKKVKDPNLIASMSGHTDGSRAFARYRKIDDEMKRELVNLLD